MKKVRVYRHPQCARCARFARAGALLDWFHRVEFSDETPRTGPLRMGEVVVEDLADGRIIRGVEGMKMLWKQIPAYAPMRLLIGLPAFRRYVEKEVSGCDGDACSL